MAKDSKNIVLSYYDCLLRTSDVELLKGPYWINDALIGFYFEYLDKKYNSDDKKEIIFVSPELTQLLKMTDPSQYNMFFDPIGAEDAKLIFFPLNNCESKEAAGGTHWSLLGYSKDDTMCYHFDSSKGFNSSIASEFSRSLFHYFSGKPEAKLTEVKCPQQDNGYDCGIYVLCLVDVIVEYFLRRKTISGCDCTPVKKSVHNKRLEMQNLIQDLKNNSNTK